MRALNLLASLGYFLHFLDRMFWIIPLIGLGYCGKGHLASGAVAFSTLGIVINLLEGFLNAQDFFSSRLSEKHRSSGLRRWAYISALYVGIICAITVAVFIPLSYSFYNNLGLRSHLSFRVIIGVWTLLPSIALHGLHLTLKKLLLHMGLPFPSIVAGLVALVSIIVSTAILLGGFGMGIFGAALATVISKLLAVLILFIFLQKQVEVRM